MVGFGAGNGPVAVNPVTTAAAACQFGTHAGDSLRRRLSVGQPQLISELWGSLRPAWRRNAVWRATNGANRAAPVNPRRRSPRARVPLASLASARTHTQCCAPTHSFNHALASADDLLAVVDAGSNADEEFCIIGAARGDLSRYRTSTPRRPAADETDASPPPALDHSDPRHHPRSRARSNAGVPRLTHPLTRPT